MEKIFGISFFGSAFFLEEIKPSNGFGNFRWLCKVTEVEYNNKYKVELFYYEARRYGIAFNVWKLNGFTVCWHYSGPPFYYEVRFDMIDSQGEHISEKDDNYILVETQGLGGDFYIEAIKAAFPAARKLAETYPSAKMFDAVQPFFNATLEFKDYEKEESFEDKLAAFNNNVKAWQEYIEKYYAAINCLQKELEAQPKDDKINQKKLEALTKKVSEECEKLFNKYIKTNQNEKD